MRHLYHAILFLGHIQAQQVFLAFVQEQVFLEFLVHQLFLLVSARYLDLLKQVYLSRVYLGLA
jgi:hypothetical protein